MSGFTLKQQVGAALLDLPRVLPRMLTRRGWINVCNRHDQLIRKPGQTGVAVAAQWSNDIHACQVFPYLGRWLMARALADWPISLTASQGVMGPPQVSFVIPHRGKEREPLLRMTLASILAQRDVSVECIVVEQSEAREIGDMPDGVRHIHLPHPTDPEPWRKSWAYNVGVESASAEIVVCHDGDILIPQGYAAEIVRKFSNERVDVAHLQRFLFCLDQTDTDAFLKSFRVVPVIPERVRQNWQGGTLAIRKGVFNAIGGYDERFIDWGGEDSEFFDRCRVLGRIESGYLPFVHLWHPPQVTKFGEARGQAVSFLNTILNQGRFERISALLLKQRSQV